jgi:serine/threonine-protein kinase RsbW
MHEVIEAVVTAMADQSFPQKDQFGMRLVLEEALVNALTHGCQGDPTKQVCVRYRVDAQRALAEIEDEGEGFDPQQVPDPLAPENLERPCGRGLLLMRSYATWVRHNRRGNCVTLCKVRSS